MYIISLFLKTMGDLSTAQLRICDFVLGGFVHWAFVGWGGGCYLYGKGLKLKEYKLFEDSDADLSWLLF